MYYLYILKCQDETLYTGITTDLDRRLKEHNSTKHGAKYTRVRRPVKVVYSKKFFNRSKASKEEFKIKSLSRLEKLKMIKLKHKNRSKFSAQMKTFTERVKDIVRKIPRGKVLTYKDVAKKAGSPKSFRAVGAVMSKNYDQGVPCHRVIRSDRRMGGYNRGGSRVKKAILIKEKAIN